MALRGGWPITTHLRSCINVLAVLVAVFATPRPGAGQSSQFVTLTLSSKLVPGEVEVGVLLPPGYDHGSGPYPLMLYLHGGGGSSAELANFRPVFDAAWASGDLPPLVVATPSARRSFYMDFRDGSQRWETFIMTEVLSRLRTDFRVRRDAAGTVISGASMGGMGSLRMALKYPNEFGAVVALEPAVEAAFAFGEIEPIDRAYRNGGIYEEIFGNPVDEEYWQANHPLYLARESLATLRRVGLEIYFEVGDEDTLALYRGAEVLHRLLFDAGVKHEYRLVRGGDHPLTHVSVPLRVRNALGFVGRFLRGEL